MGLHNEEQQKTHKSKVKYPTQTIWDDKAREFQVYIVALAFK